MGAGGSFSSSGGRRVWQRSARHRALCEPCWARLRGRDGRQNPETSGQDGVDQVGAGLGVGPLEGGDGLVGGVDGDGGDAHALGQLDEVEVGPGQVEQVAWPSGRRSPAPVRASSMLRMAYERLFMITVVTSSCSRAWVHSAWIVYIAEPSASRASTGGPGRRRPRRWPAAGRRRSPRRSAAASRAGRSRPWPPTCARCWCSTRRRRSPPRAASPRRRRPAWRRSARRSGARGGRGVGDRRRRRRPRRPAAASAPAASSRPVASTCTSQPSGTRSLGLPG